MRYSGAWGKLSREKNLKSRGTVPLRGTSLQGTKRNGEQVPVTPTHSR
jgi:hypothetical protein